jgi:hypothetical protein
MILQMDSSTFIPNHQQNRPVNPDSFDRDFTDSFCFGPLGGL